MSGEYAQRLALNIRAIAGASGESIKSVAEMFITTKDGADQAMQKMIDVGLSYQDAKNKVDEYKSSGNFSTLNADIESTSLRFLSSLRHGANLLKRSKIITLESVLEGKALHLAEQ